jgi:glycerophosphoryl diester phosphodiesterase
MQYPLPRWFAHRGGGSLAPENTLAGIRLAARLGFPAVEFDVMLSGDGTPVLIHDETLERTTNGSGLVCQAHDSVLFSLNAGDGEHVPSFAEAARLCRQYGLLANVEIKPAAGFEVQTAEAVVALLPELWGDTELLPLISSFSLPVMEIVRDRLPHFPRGQLFDPIPDDVFTLLQQHRADTLHCNARHVSDEVLAEAQAKGIPVLCYTVNTTEQAADLFARGVSGLFTDRLDLFASETSAYKALHLGC